MANFMRDAVRVKITDDELIVGSFRTPGWYLADELPAPTPFGFRFDRHGTSRLRNAALDAAGTAAVGRRQGDLGRRRGTWRDPDNESCFWNRVKPLPSSRPSGGHVGRSPLESHWWSPKLLGA